MKPIFSIGIIPGHTHTFIYFARDYIIIDYSYFLNNKFLTLIVEEIDKILEQNLSKNENLSFFFILTGPSPLMTTRAICSWAKGCNLALEIPVISFGGAEYYQREDLIIMNIFGGKYLLNFKKESKNKTIEADEINYFNFENINSIEITKGVILSNEIYCFKNVTTVFMPNFNKIAKRTYENFCNKEYFEASNLKPY